MKELLKDIAIYGIIGIVILGVNALFIAGLVWVIVKVLRALGVL